MNLRWVGGWIHGWIDSWMYNIWMENGSSILSVQGMNTNANEASARELLLLFLSMEENKWDRLGRSDWCDESFNSM